MMIKDIKSPSKLFQILLDRVGKDRPNESDFHFLEVTSLHGGLDPYELSLEYATHDRAKRCRKKNWSIRDQLEFIDMLNCSLADRPLREKFYFLQFYTAVYGMFDIEITTRVRTTRRAMEELGIDSDITMTERFL